MSQSEPSQEQLFPDAVEKLNADWFKELMKDKVDGMVNIEAGMPSMEGEGFLGVLMPFTVTTKSNDDCSAEKVRHFIVKINGGESEILYDIKPLRFHSREAFFYKDLLPLFQSVADSVLSAENRAKFSFYPKCYIAESDAEGNRALIIMDNLKEAGHEVLSFTDGLSLIELKSAVRVLAHYHAMSHLVILQKNEEINSGRCKQFLNWVPESNLKSVWGMFLADGLRWFTNSHPEKIELEAKLNQLSERSAEILGRYSDYSQGGLPVICHGDYWCNNLMYRQANGSVTDDITLVDFQCVCHGTPGKDLATLILSSTTPELRRRCTDEILVYYHECFQNACALIKLPKETLSLANLKRDFKSSLLNAVFWCFVSFQMFLTSEADDRLYWILKDMADEGVY